MFVSTKANVIDVCGN